MKKLLALLLCAALILSLGLTALADTAEKAVDITYRAIRIVIDGTEITPADVTGKAVEPFILDGTTYLPVRAVAGALGLDVEWDGGTSTVILTAGDAASYGTGTPAASSGVKSVKIYYRDIKLLIEGEEIVPTDVTGKVVEPFILDGTTYLPVRAIAEALGVDVGWDGETSTVTLTSGKEDFPEDIRCVSYSYVSTDSEDSFYDEDYTVTYTYDGKGFLVGEKCTGTWNYTTVYVNDANGNPTSVKRTGDSAFTETITYDAKGNVLTDKTVYDEPDGLITAYLIEYRYGSSGQPVKMILSIDSRSYGYREVSESVFTYDGQGLLAKTVTDCDYADDNGLEYSYSYTELNEYDADGQLIKSSSDNDGTVTAVKYSYNAGGLLTAASQSIRDAFGKDYYTSNTAYTYDEDGAPLREVCNEQFLDEPGGYTKIYEYDEDGLFYTVTTTYSYGVVVVETYMFAAR